MMMMTTQERDELDRLEAKNSHDSLHFLTVEEMTRLLWLRRAIPKRGRCAVCLGWVDIDDIVWRGPSMESPICTDCEAEGDDAR